MVIHAVTSVINLLGFAIGAALYALLFTVVVQHPLKTTGGGQNLLARRAFDRQLLAAGILGAIWNLGGLFEIISRDWLKAKPDSLFLALGYASLGFLPAVVVHSVFEKPDAESKQSNELKRWFLVVAAYGLSVTAAIAHFYQAIFDDFAPSFRAFQLLTFGYVIILAVLLVSNFRQPVGRRAIWATALAIFAVSALHLSHPHTEDNFWATELAGHQAALPLALAILYQDYRFAFADLFIKRFLSILLTALVAAGFYWLIIVNLFFAETIQIGENAAFIVVNLGFWIATALLFPQLNKFSTRVVDKIILRRMNYAALQTKIMDENARTETVFEVLENVCDRLKQALTAGEGRWQEHTFDAATQQQYALLILATASGAEIIIPTTDQPGYKISLDKMLGGRRLLSDEIEMLESVAIQAARRIDALRVTHERCEQELREQEFSKLATEAELRALRAQINPHFLFNALTTISYLIDTAPEKANRTLLRLTSLLRGVLRTTDEFSTLGDELKLIESYLEIESARFEERLTVKIGVAPELLSVRVPSLILQPLVENAIRHGITPKKEGGVIAIKAHVKSQKLSLEISDTGAGIKNEDLEIKRQSRIGLNNVEERLQLYFQDAASFSITSQPQLGTTVRIVIDLNHVRQIMKRQTAIAA